MMNRQLILCYVLGVLSLWHLPVSATSYYVSISGDDTQTGTMSDPFRTIRHAVTAMQAGDTCVIMAGIYREMVQVTKNDLTFLATEGDSVEISGFDPVNGWTQHQGNIYVADVDWSLNTRNQVLYQGDMMVLARWPNKATFNPFELATEKAFGTNSSISNASIPNINWEQGGVLFFLGKNRWTSWRMPIAGTAPGEITFNPLSNDWQWGGSHNPDDGGDFYLMNHIDALDAAGEWFLDPVQDKLYFYPPGGGNPATDAVLVKRRTTAFNLANRSGVVLDGLTITGANVNLSNSIGCTIRNCHILYGNHTIGTGAAAFVSEASISMTDNSRDNLITRNNIQWGAANGIVLKGTDNVVSHNYIGNFNYLSSYGAPVELRGANDLINNELFNGGRDLVRGGGSGSVCAYNDMHHSNLNNDDCGPIYFCCGQYNNTTIHHNWIHDCTSPDGHFEKYKATGIYLDNSTEDVIVHHNVLWNLEWAGIQINWAGTNLLIYNNTIWSNSGPESKAMGRWVNGYEFSNVQVFNTLANEGELHYTSEGNNVIMGLNDDPFEDFANRNFMPKAGTPAIDAGQPFAGYTDNAMGSAPDAGAYERGDTLWTVGPDWELAGLTSDIPSVERPLADLHVFPNPVDSGQLQVVLELRGNKKLKLLDMRGSVIVEESFDAFQHQVDVSSLTPGLYILQAGTAQGVFSAKISIR